MVTPYNPGIPRSFQGTFRRQLGRLLVEGEAAGPLERRHGVALGFAHHVLSGAECYRVGSRTIASLG